MARKKAGGRRREDTRQENIMINDKCWIMIMVMLTMMNAGQMSYIDILMLFSAGAWATVRITRDGVFTHKRFTHRRLCAQKLLHTEVFTQRSLYTYELLNREALTHRSFFTHWSFYTEALTQRSLYTEELLHTDVFENFVNASPRQDLWAHKSEPCQN